MAKKRGRKTSSSSSISPLIGVLVIVLLGAGAWFLLHRRPPAMPVGVPAPTAPLAVSAERVDPANEGRLITVSGKVTVPSHVRDPQLGVGADAVALLRQVEMMQWNTCAPADNCEYALQWSQKLIDTRSFKPSFHAVKGRENPAHMPFTSEEFVAENARIGAFGIDPAALVSTSAPVALAVHVAQLPPNLAATFREYDGKLYAGADPDHPAAGDLRVSFRIVEAGAQRVTGIQQGDRLKPATAH